MRERDYDNVRKFVVLRFIGNPAIAGQRHQFGFEEGKPVEREADTYAQGMNKSGERFVASARICLIRNTGCTRY
jgi:hypothetical protein